MKSELGLSPSQHTILSALRYHERFGLEINDAIENCGGKRFGFSSLYPTLKVLEEKGFVTSRWEDAQAGETKARRKFFKITGRGVKALEHSEEFISQIGLWQPV